jgi:primosomal protein N' (replication factor Y)
MMSYYYNVWVSTKQFRSSSTLTYSSDIKLKSGSIVSVPFRNKTIIGLVKDRAEAPKFTCKPINSILQKNTLPDSDIALLKWLIDYYPANSATHLQLFIPNRVSKFTENFSVSSPTISPANGMTPPTLNDEQSNAIKTILSSNSRTFLIHGNTGSGKTRVYVELIRECLKSLKSVILLIPEIGLSPQIISTIDNFFPDSVITMNSGLSEKTKLINWGKILTSVKPIVVIGPRSALFMPVNNLGLIIIDEAHDDSYKQESSPFYQSTRVAAKLSDITNSKLILGTASPLISDYYLFSEKKIPIIRMIKSAAAYEKEIKPNIEIIDLSNKSMFTKSSWLSNPLLDSVQKSLYAKEQSLIFLNRRGTAVVVICQNCGWKALCPNCNTSLTYHHDHHHLVCHSCGHREISPSACPKCDSHNITYKGVGTKAIEVELKKIFPGVKIRRFDRDNTKKDSLSENYQDISEGNTDIIIGTQIITKGLDLPKLSTVGIIMADQNLTFPDFSSEEKNYQTLLQVMGRVGRGHQDSSNIIIQTYSPNSRALLSATSKDYDIFYNDQLVSRAKYLFPPYVYMLKIYCKKSSSKNAELSCEELISSFRGLGYSIKISSPSPSFREKIGKKYQWQFVIRSKNRSNLLALIKHIPNDWFYDIDPINLL